MSVMRSSLVTAAWCNGAAMGVPKEKVFIFPSMFVLVFGFFFIVLVCFQFGFAYVLAPNFPVRGPLRCCEIPRWSPIEL